VEEKNDKGSNDQLPNRQPLDREWVKGMVHHYLRMLNPLKPEEDQEFLDYVKMLQDRRLAEAPLESQQLQ
jgi:hypothetical protein